MLSLQSTALEVKSEKKSSHRRGKRGKGLREKKYWLNQQMAAARQAELDTGTKNPVEVIVRSLRLYSVQKGLMSFAKRCRHFRAAQRGDQLSWNTFEVAIIFLEICIDYRDITNHPLPLLQSMYVLGTSSPAPVHSPNAKVPSTSSPFGQT